MDRNTRYVVVAATKQNGVRERYESARFMVWDSALTLLNELVRTGWLGTIKTVQVAS